MVKFVDIDVYLIYINAYLMDIDAIGIGDGGGIGAGVGVVVVRGSGGWVTLNSAAVSLLGSLLKWEAVDH